jgi:hypothetical protein
MLERIKIDLNSQIGYLHCKSRKGMAHEFGSYNLLRK